MTLKLKTAPTAAPISLSEAKPYLHETGSDQDSVISLLIASITAHLDGYTGILGRCLIEQTWEYFVDAFPSGDLQIPLGNLIAVSSVEYIDPTTGVYVTWSSSNYTTDNSSIEGWIRPVTDWPTPKADVANPIRITFTAGFGSGPASVPGPIREAILLMLADRFDNRGAVAYEATPSILPLAVDARLAPYRRIKI